MICFYILAGVVALVALPLVVFALALIGELMIAWAMDRSFGVSLDDPLGPWN